ncbi:MAG: tryptophan synthase subunit alpha [bacterium]|nr:tryptophan synthase subunit alpha [bacterium]
MIVPYITLGFPTIKKSVVLIEKFLKFCDYVEVGIPFSDPVADGKTIQYSSYIAIKNGVSVEDAIEVIKQFGERLFIITYLNPIYRFGIEKFLNIANKYKLKGIIIPDYMIGFEDDLYIKIKNFSINFIPLITPNTKNARMLEIVKYADEFLYVVSILGTTGIRNTFASNLMEFLKKIKKLYFGKVLLGFGISNKKHIQKYKTYVDYFVVGSYIIENIKIGRDPVMAIKDLYD